MDNYSLRESGYEIIERRYEKSQWVDNGLAKSIYRNKILILYMSKSDEIESEKKETNQLLLYIPPEIKEKFREISDQNERTMSGQLRYWVKNNPSMSEEK